MTNRFLASPLCLPLTCCRRHPFTLSVIQVKGSLLLPALLTQFCQNIMTLLLLLPLLLLLLLLGLLLLLFTFLAASTHVRDLRPRCLCLTHLTTLPPTWLITSLAAAASLSAWLLLLHPQRDSSRTSRTSCRPLRLLLSFHHSRHSLNCPWCRSRRAPHSSCWQCYMPGWPRQSGGWLPHWSASAGMLAGLMSSGARNRHQGFGGIFTGLPLQPWSSGS